MRSTVGDAETLKHLLAEGWDLYFHRRLGRWYLVRDGEVRAVSPGLNDLCGRLQSTPDLEDGAEPQDPAEDPEPAGTPLEAYAVLAAIASLFLIPAAASLFRWATSRG